jgi:hypothetical protein
MIGSCSVPLAINVPLITIPYNNLASIMQYVKILVSLCTMSSTPGSIVRVIAGGITIVDVIVYGLPPRVIVTLDNISPPTVPSGLINGI